MELDDAGRAEFERLGYGETELIRETGVPAAAGEESRLMLERMWVRPTCDVNGLLSGYTGEGGKTIIPARAMAKVSFRLVPHQDPQKIAHALEEFVVTHAPSGVRVRVEILHTARPVLVPRDSIMMQAGLTALEKGFGHKAVFIGEGGSIPITGTFQQVLQVPVVMLGYGLSTDNIHSPNEKFPLEHFYNGIRTTVAFFEEVARLHTLQCGYRMTEGGGPEGASCPMHCSVFSRHKIKVKEGDDAAVFVSPVSKPQRSGPC